jgi:hypothetical protein
MVQVMDKSSAQAYLSANPKIDACFYLVPYKVTIDGKPQLGWENQGYPSQRMYVKRGGV